MCMCMFLFLFSLLFPLTIQKDKWTVGTWVKECVRYSCEWLSERKDTNCTRIEQKGWKRKKEKGKKTYYRFHRCMYTHKSKCQQGKRGSQWKRTGLDTREPFVHSSIESECNNHQKSSLAASFQSTQAVTLWARMHSASVRLHKSSCRFNEWPTKSLSTQTPISTACRVQFGPGKIRAVAYD